MRHRSQSGFTIVEMSVAMVISTLIMGTIIAVQQTATDGFQGAVGEERLSRVMRDGAAEVRKDVRSLNKDTLTVDTTSAAMNGQQAVMTFQEAIAFDVQTGQTTWGAGSDAGGTVEYWIQGTDLVRRVRDSQGVLQPQSDRVLVANLDLSQENGPPCEIEIDPEDGGWLRLLVRTEMTLNDERTQREVETVIHLESVWGY